MPAGIPAAEGRRAGRAAAPARPAVIPAPPRSASRTRSTNAAHAPSDARTSSSSSSSASDMASSRESARRAARKSCRWSMPVIAAAYTVSCAVCLPTRPASARITGSDSRYPRWASMLPSIRARVDAQALEHPGAQAHAGREVMAASGTASHSVFHARPSRSCSATIPSRASPAWARPAGTR